MVQHVRHGLVVYTTGRRSPFLDNAVCCQRKGRSGQNRYSFESCDLDSSHTGLSSTCPSNHFRLKRRFRIRSSVFSDGNTDNRAPCNHHPRSMLTSQNPEKDRLRIAYPTDIQGNLGLLPNYVFSATVFITHEAAKRLHKQSRRILTCNETVSASAVGSHRNISCLCGSDSILFHAD